MEIRSVALIILLTILGCLTTTAGRQGRSSRPCRVAGAIPNPAQAPVLDRLHPPNDGRCIVSWPDTVPGSVADRSGSGNLIWSQACPSHASGENTRVALDNVPPSSWASTHRYILLSNADGSLIRTGEWTCLDTDTDKVILHRDMIYVVQTATASAL